MSSQVTAVLPADKSVSGGGGGGGGETEGLEAPEPSETNEREFSLPVLSGMALLVGIVAAFGAIVFKFLIAGIYNLAFYQTFSFDYDPNSFGEPSPLGPLVILVPVIGGLIVVALVRAFAPEAKGHGVPEVMYAIYHKGGNVRGVVAIVKSLASAISIGTGASVGREGPIIQIGSSFGSTIARHLRLVRPQKITLLSAGAGAGIAATFNTPLGGVLFASEVLLPEISPRSFLPVVIATATSTYVYRLVMGGETAFIVHALSEVEFSVVNFHEIGLAALTGVIMGVAAYTFVKVLAFMEDWFEELPLNAYVQNIIGMLAVGLMGYGFFLASGHHHVLSVGYSTIQDILSGGNASIVLLVALFVGKLLATSISLGAGASGGIFSPSLFMGSTLGAAIGAAGAMVFPDAGISVPTFAMIGMGAMVGGATSAAMTAIVMIFEMTRDYNIILPLVLAVALSIGIRRALVVDDIYTIKLRNRGRPIPTNRTTNMFLVQPVTEIMNRDFHVLPGDMKVAEALKQIDVSTAKLIVTDGQRISGFIRLGTLRADMEKLGKERLDSISSNAFIMAAERSNLNDVVTRMSRRQRSYAIVIKGNRGVPRPDEIVGVIDREELAQSVIRNHYG
ncbi:chloride channel core protein [Nitratireductor indicus C115]|uniref:Chloride channel core protein n=1 Tax=Nitratireductor indicus C115 TaxID=1231190 RepID=K2P808_9HYPH|nr:chloride channel protein [Nitratireductor indicus]EKF43371.1 chloride channel core protein [Nitratireductor indicus C115]SFQ08944.1 chloride channel protein, CIC family [Nitratireductor indicus]